MEKQLAVKDTIQQIYAKYDTYLISAGKFLLALVSFLMINARLGYMERLNSMIIVLILALFCSFLPIHGLVLLGTAVILGHLYALSLSALLVGGSVLVILLLLYFGVAPGKGYVLVLTPIALALNVPCLIPLAFGLLAAPSAGIGMVVSVIGYYTLEVVSRTAGSASAAQMKSAAEESKDLAGQAGEILKGVLEERTMILMLVALLAVLFIVYFIRRMEMKYAWSIAIGTGTVIYLIIYLTGSMTLGITDGMVFMIIGTVVSAGIACLLQWWFFDLDYRGTKKLQFEDDEYYYYVKAIPKKKGSEKRGELKDIL